MILQRERIADENYGCYRKSHRNGISALLADKFIRGACEAGHEIWRFDAAFKYVYSCMGCNHCGHHGGMPCMFQDFRDWLCPHLTEADMVALVTPVYYRGVSAQLRVVIDRWKPIVLVMRGKRVALMTTQYNSKEWVFEPL